MDVLFNNKYIVEYTPPPKYTRIQGKIITWNVFGNKKGKFYIRETVIMDKGKMKDTSYRK